jgi:predicted dehydrogenase
MAERWGWEETATDWQAVIDRKDIDAIDICLPNHMHGPVAIAAAQAGKTILCEKPLAMSLAEARMMADAARGVPTLVWFNYRRVPAIAFAHQLIHEGRLGRVFHYNASYKQQWGADTTRPPSWKMDPSLAGSGVGDDLLTHLLDAALYLNGPMTRVVATTRTFAPNRPVDDAVVAMVEFANGSVGTFEATRFGIGCKNCNAFEVHAEKGMLRFNLERLNHLQFLDATEPSTEQGLRDLLVTDMKHPVFPNFWRPGHIIGYEHTFIAALADFVQCLGDGQPFHPDFRDAYGVQLALDAVERSAASGRWEKVDAA